MSTTADDLWQRIAADPDGDAASYAVYADAVGGDLGERIVVMVQHRAGPVLATYLEKHRDALYGKALAKHPSIHWDWHLGYLRGVTYMPAGPDDPVKIVEAILALECAKLLRELVVFDQLGPDKYADLARPATLAAIDVVVRTRSLEDAIAAPDAVSVRWLDLAVADGTALPDALWQFTNLGWLQISSPTLRAIPPRIGELAQLFRLELGGCYELRDLADELWGLEKLHELVTWNTFGLPQKFKLARVGPLLAGFARARTPKPRRLIEAMFATGNAARGAALATRDDLLAALDSNVGDVRSAVLAELVKVEPDRLAGAIPEGAVFALVGKTNYDKKGLKAKLAERGAKLAGKVTDDVTHAIIGESPGGKQHALPEGAVLVLEAHVVKALEADVPAQDLEAIRAQLATRDEAKLSTAIAALQDGVDASLVGALVIVAIDTTLEKKPRDGAKKLLARYAPAAVTTAMREHLKVSVLMDGMGEANRYTRIAGFVKDSEGAVDGVAFALALVGRARAGTQYVFKHGTDDDMRTVVASILARATPPTSLELQALDLAYVPVAVTAFPQIEEILLYGNPMTRFPRTLLELPNLKRVNLANTRVLDVPREAAVLPIEYLSLARSGLVEFPMGVLALARTLRELDVSNTRTYMPDEARIRGMPEEIRTLTKLEKLHYQYNIIDKFPEGLFLLPALVELDLMQCDLPEAVPVEQLQMLPKLARLDLRYSTWGNTERKMEIAYFLPKLEIVI